MGNDRLVNKAEEWVQEVKQRLEREPVFEHRFLRSFEQRRLDDDEMRRFAIQWYKTARGHKLAFPALIYNIQDDDVRFELVEILRDEYGNGNREYIHAKLLMRFVSALGVSEREVDAEVTLPAVERFSEQVLRIWRDGDPVLAFGLHFALEFLAASLHAHFARGLRKYDHLSRESREYFEYHKIAEEQHADYSEFGMEFYGTTNEGRQKLEEGIRVGVELLDQLWAEFDTYIFAGAA